MTVILYDQHILFSLYENTDKIANIQKEDIIKCQTYRLGAKGLPWKAFKQ